jgi:putative pyruvate formate lyase activating enzyme
MKSYDIVFSADGIVRLPDLPPEGFTLLKAIGGTPPAPVKPQKDNRELARFSRLRRTKVPISDLDTFSTSNLWQIHNDALSNLTSSVHQSDPSVLEVKIELAHRMLSSCEMCELHCGIDRCRGERGACGNGREAYYSSCFLNWAEEKHLIPSITLFLNGCNWRCPYCQYPHQLDPEDGKPLCTDKTVELIEQLSAQGGQNLHWLGGNPDQHLWSILRVIQRIPSQIPIVWNTNGYASTYTMNLLKGVVDTYIIDFRYGNNECATRYKAGPMTWEILTRNLLSVNAQEAEVIVRHLQLPGHLDCCTIPILKWLAENLSDVKVNLMNEEYYPANLASQFPEIDRRVSLPEQKRSLQKAVELDINLVS